MASKYVMGVTAPAPDALPKRTASAAKKRPRNARMDAVVKHAHASERFSFAKVAAAVSSARGKKTKA